MKIKTLIMIAAMLPGQAFGLTALCIEDASTGLNWQNGKWVPTNYYLSQHIVQAVSPDMEYSRICKTALEVPGRSMEPTVSDEGYRSSWGCWAVYEPGEGPTLGNVYPCHQTLSATDEITSASCDTFLAGEYTFELPGEFLTRRTYSAFGEPDDEYRDSLVISVGKCSVIAK